MLLFDLGRFTAVIIEEDGRSACCPGFIIVCEPFFNQLEQLSIQ